jgi:hypothetical protein
LAEKIGYAWDHLGWRVFYVDANSAVSPGAGGATRPLPVEVFQSLSATFPQALFIPEWADEAYYRVPRVAPYRSSAGRPRSPEAASAAADPRAFEVVVTTGTATDMEKARPELADCAKAGDVFLIQVDRDNPQHQAYVLDVVRRGTQGRGR